MLEYSEINDFYKMEEIKPEVVTHGKALTQTESSGASSLPFHQGTVRIDPESNETSQQRDQVVVPPWLRNLLQNGFYKQQSSSFSSTAVLVSNIHHESQELPVVVGVKLKGCSFFRVRKERYGLIKRPPILRQQVEEVPKLSEPPFKIMPRPVKTEDNPIKFVSLPLMKAPPVKSSPPAKITPPVKTEPPITIPPAIRGLPEPVKIVYPIMKTIPRALKTAIVPEGEIKEEVTESSSGTSEATEAPPIVIVARDMVENAVLPKPIFSVLTRKERFFLFCVLSMIDNSSVIDHKLPEEDLLKEVNDRLDLLNKQHKRKDDRLRWFYKRFIRFLLLKHTGYRPTKQYRACEFNSTIVNIFFKSAARIPENICNTTFASKKRLLTMFRNSPEFTQAAASFIENDLMKDHLEESNYLFNRLFKVFHDHYHDGIALVHLAKRFYPEEYLRLPWRTGEVVETIKLLQTILKLV